MADTETTAPTRLVAARHGRTDARDVGLAARWADLGGDPGQPGRAEVVGPRDVMSSAFDVVGFAASTVGAAALAIAELAEVRLGGPPRRVRVDRSAVAASFRYETLQRPEGWEVPAVWDRLAGDHRCADGWIRLHTNYSSHRDAALTVLGCAPERAAVAAATAGWAGDDLEAAVVGAGGCAAFQRSEADWADHPAGRATAGEPPVSVSEAITQGGRWRGLGRVSTDGLPLSGVRVLDLTRVIAGPTATRLLAAYGAEVLRIDPPGFEEVPALLPEVTAGKRCAALDLRTAAGRHALEDLVTGAHVLVSGLRPGALAGLGLDPERLRDRNPHLITVTHDAYGWAGPWKGRRGFDSLVQMSTGIAESGGRAAGQDRPVPLPAQALDHGLGHLLAAATCRAITDLVTGGVVSDVRGSLVGAANAVLAARRPEVAGQGAPDLSHLASERTSTAWGPLLRVPLATHIEGIEPAFAVEAGPLGRHRAAWG